MSRKGLRFYAPKSPSPLIRRLGLVLFGAAQWQSAMAAALEVNIRTVRYWTTGEEEPPIGVWRELADLAQARGAELAELVAEILSRAASQETRGAKTAVR
jgi:hypothetical protein